MIPDFFSLPYPLGVFPPQPEQEAQPVQKVEEPTQEEQKPSLEELLFLMGYYV
jgi:hypothetical protein